MDIINKPLGWFLKFAYDLTGSIGISILLLTLAINILLFPLSVRQQRSMAKQTALKPKLDRLREKYADNKQKLSQEMQNLYATEGVSMTGGCLTALLRLPFLYGVYAVIGNPEAYLGTGIDFTFLGLDLKASPQIKEPSLLWIFPLFSFAMAFLSSLVSLHQNKVNNPEAAKSGGIMYLMPFLSLYIAFVVHAALGLYWGFSSLVSMIIQIIVNKYYGPYQTLALNYKKTIKKRRQHEADKKAARNTVKVN